MDEEYRIFWHHIAAMFIEKDKKTLKRFITERAIQGFMLGIALILSFEYMLWRLGIS